MNKIIIIHNPRCGKSREGLKYLEEKIKDSNFEIRIRLYQKNLLNKEELTQIIKKLNIKPSELVRVKEEDYKDLILKIPNLSENELIDAMVLNPKLIERPIIIKGNKAVIGRPKERIDELF